MTDYRIKHNKLAYNKIASAYHERTKNLDMKWQVAMFSDMLPVGGSILDFMSGPSRDAKTFTNLGYDVTCTDLEPQFLDIIKKDLPSVDVIEGDARYVDIGKTFDGVWCNAGIFMLPKSETNAVLENIANHLKPEGSLYINFKLFNSESGQEERVYFDKKFGFERYESFFKADEIRNVLNPLFDIRREMISYAQNINYRTHPFVDVFAVKK